MGKIRMRRKATEEKKIEAGAAVTALMKGLRTLNVVDGEECSKYIQNVYIQNVHTYLQGIKQQAPNIEDTHNLREGERENLKAMDDWELADAYLWADLYSYVIQDSSTVEDANAAEKNALVIQNSIKDSTVLRSIVSFQTAIEKILKLRGFLDDSSKSPKSFVLYFKDLFERLLALSTSVSKDKISCVDKLLFDILSVKEETLFDPCIRMLLTACNSKKDIRIRLDAVKLVCDWYEYDVSQVPDGSHKIYYLNGLLEALLTLSTSVSNDEYDKVEELLDKTLSGKKDNMVLQHIDGFLSIAMDTKENHEIRLAALKALYSKNILPVLKKSKSRHEAFYNLKLSIPDGDVVKMRDVDLSDNKAVQRIYHQLLLLRHGTVSGDEEEDYAEKYDFIALMFVHGESGDYAGFTSLTNADIDEQNGFDSYLFTEIRDVLEIVEKFRKILEEDPVKALLDNFYFLYNMVNSIYRPVKKNRVEEYIIDKFCKEAVIIPALVIIESEEKASMESRKLAYEILLQPGVF